MICPRHQKALFAVPCMLYPNMADMDADEIPRPQRLARDMMTEIESWQCHDVDLEEIWKVVDIWIEKGVKYLWMIPKLSVENIEAKFPMEEMADANLWIQHIRDKMVKRFCAL